MIVNIFYVAYNYPVALFMLSRGLRRCWVDLVSRHVHKVDFLDDLGSRLMGGLCWVLMDPHVEHEITPGGALLAAVWHARPVQLLAKWLPYYFWALLLSELLGFVEVVVWFCLGIWWMRDDRDSGHGIMDETQQHTEDAWGFGQLVPLFLLFLPFLQFFESYAAYSLEDARNRENRENSKPTTQT
jgi:hypothetical protein